MIFTLNVAKVLAAINRNGGEHYGVELSLATGIRSGNLYPILARLVDEGMIFCSRDEAAQPNRPVYPRRYFQLTATGKEYLPIARQALRTEARYLQDLLSDEPADE